MTTTGTDPKRPGRKKNAGNGAVLDAVVVGAGQGGLGTSYFLKQFGLDHVVLERNRVAESWRTQRWDSFAVNTPNALNALPGDRATGPQADGFYTRDELVASFVRYARRFALPLRERTEVVAVEPDPAAAGFRVTAQSHDGTSETLSTQSVVVASGIMNVPKMPQLGAALPDTVTQLHTAHYRNPAQLLPGAVLVVGSGQSGVQIAEDLLAAGRKVYLATSRVGRCPRRYRGRDLDEWLWESGFFDLPRSEVADPAVFRRAQPQVSGVGRYGHSLSLQFLAQSGGELLGRLVAVEGTTLCFDDSLKNNICFADADSAESKVLADRYIAEQGIAAPPPEDDPADRPWVDVDRVTAPRNLDLAAAEIGTVLWCTGFTADFSWLRLPVLDETGRPRHDGGAAPLPGIYFIGFPWLRRRKSGIICGIEDDAAFIAGQVARRAARAEAPG